MYEVIKESPSLVSGNDLLNFKYFIKHQSLNFYPIFLRLGYENTTHVLLFFNFVEVINQYTNKQVSNELATNKEIEHKVESKVRLVVLFWLHVYPHSISTALHNSLPTLSRHHIK